MEEGNDLLDQLQLVEGAREGGVHDVGFQLQPGGVDRFGRGVAARGRERTAEGLHGELRHVDRTALDGQCAGKVGDRHLLEQNLLQGGLQREVEILRNLDGRSGRCRFGGSLGGLSVALLRSRDGTHQLIEIEQRRLHVETSFEHVVAQEPAQVVRQLAVGGHVAPADRHQTLAQRQGHRRHGGRGALDPHLGQPLDVGAHPLDGERARSLHLLEPLLLDVGHAAGHLHVGRNQSGQRDRVLQRIDLLHGAEVHLAVGGCGELQVADRRGGRERRREGVAGHREPEVRNLYRSAVERAARVGRLGGHADAGHGLGQGGVFEAALPDAERQLEGRQAVADQASPGPGREGHLARGLQILEIPGVEGGDERQDFAELNLGRGQFQIHVDPFVGQGYPAVEHHADGVHAQRVVAQREDPLLHIGLQVGVDLRLDAVDEREALGPEEDLRCHGLELQVALGGREIASQIEIQRIDGGVHVGRIVVVAQDGIGDRHVAQGQPERRTGVLRVLIRLLLDLRSFLRGLHDIPVHPAVGALAAVDGGPVEQDAAHLEARVAEERHQVHHHRDPVGGDDRIPHEGLRAAYERQSVQLQRGVGKVAQQADIQLLEIETGRQHLVGFALHDIADLSLQDHRHDECDGQKRGDGNRRYLCKFFHILTFEFSVHRRKRVVSASRNPSLR